MNNKPTPMTPKEPIAIQSEERKWLALANAGAVGKALKKRMTITDLPFAIFFPRIKTPSRL
jgi:hypothetical protein